MIGGRLPQGVLAGAWKLPEQGADRQFELFRIGPGGAEAGAYHTFPENALLQVDQAHAQCPGFVAQAVDRQVRPHAGGGRKVGAELQRCVA